MTEDEMVGWHRRLHGHEFDQAPGDGEGQGGLACCSPWGRESNTSEQLRNNNKAHDSSFHFNETKTSVNKQASTWITCKC